MRDYVIVLMENLCWIPHKLAMFVLVSKALFISKKHLLDRRYMNKL